MKRAFSADIEDASDADEDVTVPLPKGCGQLRLEWGPLHDLPSGPVSFAGMFEWSQNVVERTLCSLACYPFLSAPHVFGDLKERVDKRLWTKLCRLQQKFTRKAEAAAEKSASFKGQGRGRGKRCDKAMNLQELGDKFLHAAAKLLDDNMNYFKKSGACLKCGQTCCWTPRQGDSETAAAPEAIWVEAAGNICTTWGFRAIECADTQWCCRSRED